VRILMEKATVEQVKEHGVDGTARATYRRYAEEWARRAGLDEWKGRTSRLIGGGSPDIRAEVLHEWEELDDWLYSRVWPNGYREIVAALNNFRAVLAGFLHTFMNHADQQGKMYFTLEFYRIPKWNPGLYEARLQEFNTHTDLVADFVLELTRAANLVCDRVRESLDPAFRLEEGAVVLHGSRPEYTENERTQEMPFPGLKEFEQTTRFERAEHYGETEEGEAEGARS
jgi:hypothetical protein